MLRLISSSARALKLHHSSLSSTAVTARHLHAHRPAAMARILCSDPIDASCPELLRSAGHDVTTVATALSHAELLAQIPDYEVLIARSGSKVDRTVLEAATHLQLIGRAGTGVDNIDIVSATKQGVLVMNTPFGNTLSAAELTVGLITSVSRLADSGSSTASDSVSASTPRQSEIHGKTLGVIGLGRIGREVAARCNAFGMNVIGYDPLLSSASAKAHNVEPVALAELFARSDYISLHVPLNANTKQLVNAARLGLCKDGVRIINSARAGLIDHAALLDALTTNKVAGVAFDILPPTGSAESNNAVWTQLVNHPRVIATPHIGALTADAQQKVARDLAYKVMDALAGKSFSGVVNAPNIDFGRRAQHVTPYLSLAEKLGSLHAQLLDATRLTRVLVIAEGRTVTSTPAVADQLVSGVLKGLLSHMLEEEVTFANAKAIGDVMGVQCVEHKHDDVVTKSSFANLLTVVCEFDDGTSRRIAGTVFGTDQLRLVALDDLAIDAIPRGSMLMFANTDEPGVLHSVTSVLAKNAINIGCFGLARQATGGNAVGVLNVDDAIPDAVIDELEALTQVSNVRRVNLLELNTAGGAGRVWAQFLQPKDEMTTTTDSVEVVDVTHNKKPSAKPSSPNFGSGPCKKRPGYALSKLSDVVLGRSHRSVLGKGLLEEAIVRSKQVLKLPDDYVLGIVPASDTGAFEMAMWNMLGPRPVDVCYWETFGKQWFNDVTTELGLTDVTAISAPFGELPDLTRVNSDHDVLFTWNGTTSGVKVPDADWIADDRTGLTFNDATSAAFAMDMPWHKIDVCTFSWQKVLGGEGGHGVLVLSPRAIERLESFVPTNRPIPKIFRLTNKTTGKLARGIFDGSTINTPSMLCVEDYVDALRWAESVGGVDGLMAISQRNLAVIEDFVADNSRWIQFLAASKAVRSNTSVCLTFPDLANDQVKQLTKLLEREHVAVDINSYRDAPPGIRIWCGATVETKDLEALMPWIKWAYSEVKSASAAAANAE